MVSEIEQLFQCVVCGKAWPSKQSLRAHMKVHKGEYVRTSFHANREAWERFDAICKEHKTTTCHVLNTLIKGINEGAESGDISLPKILSPNPVIININDYFLAQPRSRYKIPVDPSTIHHRAQPQHCPMCGEKKVYVRSIEGGFLEGECVCGAKWLIHSSGTSFKPSAAF